MKPAALTVFLESRGLLPGAVRTIVSFGIVIAIWQFVATTVVTNSMLLAPPLDVVRAIVAQAQHGALWHNSIATAISLAVAFPISVVIGVFVGLALSSNRLLSMMVGPVLTAFSSIPIIALAPLFVAWLGLGLASKFVLVGMVSVFPVIVTTESALNAADKDLIEASRSFNASAWQVFSTVTLPYALPFLVGGIRVAWARALVGVVVAEFFGSFAGYGYAIMAAGQSFDTATLLAYVFVLGLLGLVGSLLLEFAERKLAPWRHE